jgi:ABC-2 type transport system ATP-binding protein
MSSGEAVIEIRGLGRRFKNTHALSGIDLDIKRGELFGIVGPDGSGKTTLIQSICAILDPTKGSIKVDGFDTVKDASNITSRIGYMSQAYSLYEDLTAGENLEFFAKIRKVPDDLFARRVKRLLSFSGLSPFLKRRTKQLSGGMQKKLALCCNLIHEPDILILDEPTLGVDPLSRRHLWEMIEEFHSQGKTIIMSTSYMDEAKRCERLAFLLEGRLLACDRPEAISENLEEVFASHIKRVEWEKRLPFPARVAEGDVIRVEGLSKRFDGFTAVDGIDFTVKRGEVFGFVGPNGSGKTTTIRALCGIIPPSEGSVVVAGTNVVKDPALVKGRIGYMSQRFSLSLDLAVEENMDFFGRVYGVDPKTLQERKNWLLETAGLKGGEKTLTKEVSGAVRQRLALGCSLLHHPDVLFLDEPTSGIDPASRKAFWEMITLLAESGTTVFVTTHYLREVEGCSRVAFLHQGRILALDAPERLKTVYNKDSLEDVFLHLMEGM